MGGCCCQCVARSLSLGLAGLGLGMLASGEDPGPCLSDPAGRRHIRITGMCRPAAGSVRLGVVTTVRVTVGLGDTVTGDGPASHLDRFCPAALDAKQASGHLRFGFKLGPLRVRVACDPRPVSCEETRW
jgi:hypothetical protein